MRRLLIVLTVLAATAVVQAVTIVFQDAFTEGTNTVLTNHTPTDVGTSWTLGEDTSSGASDWEVIASTDWARPEATTASVLNIVLATPSPALSSADYLVQALIVAEGGVDDPFALVVRWASASSFYAAVIYAEANATDCYITKDATDLGSGNCNLGNADTVKFRVSGGATTTLTILDGLDTVLLTVDDSSSPITAAGSAGLGCGNLRSGGATDDCASTVNLDDYVVTDETPASGPPPGSLGLLGVGR